MRLNRGSIQDHRALAFLYLRNAFISITRGIHSKILVCVLAPLIHAIVSIFLQLEEIETIEDDTNLKLWIDKGVRQGSPLIPSLFIVFINTLA